MSNDVSLLRIVVRLKRNLLVRVDGPFSVIVRYCARCSVGVVYPQPIEAAVSSFQS